MRDKSLQFCIDFVCLVRLKKKTENLERKKKKKKKN